MFYVQQGLNTYVRFRKRDSFETGVSAKASSGAARCHGHKNNSNYDRGGNGKKSLYLLSISFHLILLTLGVRYF